MFKLLSIIYKNTNNKQYIKIEIIRNMKILRKKHINILQKIYLQLYHLLEKIIISNVLEQLNMKAIFWILFLSTCFATLDWIKVGKDNMFVNDKGSTFIFHGVNIVYKQKPWFPNTNKYDKINSLTSQDIEDLKKWGFNIVRLGVMWPGVRPEQGSTNNEYLDLVEQTINKLGDAGIYTLVDLHQDLFSRLYCGEGVPDSLLKDEKSNSDFPWPLDNPYKKNSENQPILEQCLSVKNFGLYYLTPMVNKAFDKLYKKGSLLNNEINEFWKAVATRFSRNPNVIGYDLINEPIAGNLCQHPIEFLDPFNPAETKYLQPLYQQLHETIRKVDTRHILFFEGASNNMFSTGFTSVPGGDAYKDRSALSYHVYCGLVSPSGCPVWPTFCEYFEDILFYLRLKEFKNLGCGGILTEFGALSDSESCVTEVHRVARKAEERLQGWIYWQYKIYDDLTTANTDESQGFYYKNETFQTQKVVALTRPYARKIAGAVKVAKYDYSSHTYTLQYTVTAATKSESTILYANKAYFNYRRPDYRISTPKVSVEMDDISGGFVIIELKLQGDLLEGTQIDFLLRPM